MTALSVIPAEATVGATWPGQISAQSKRWVCNMIRMKLRGGSCTIGELVEIFDGVQAPHDLRGEIPTAVVETLVHAALREIGARETWSL